MRRARLANAERSGVLADLRDAEIARLEILRDHLDPVLAQAPKDCDLFDIGVSHGDRPAPLHRSCRLRRDGARPPHLSFPAGHAPWPRHHRRERQCRDGGRGGHRIYRASADRAGKGAGFRFRRPGRRPRLFGRGEEEAHRRRRAPRACLPRACPLCPGPAGSARNSIAPFCSWRRAQARRLSSFCCGSSASTGPSPLFSVDDR